MENIIYYIDARKRKKKMNNMIIEKSNKWQSLRIMKQISVRYTVYSSNLIIYVSKHVRNFG